MGLVVNHSKDFSDLGREQQKPLDGLSVHSQLGSVPEFLGSGLALESTVLYFW